MTVSHRIVALAVVISATLAAACVSGGGGTPSPEVSRIPTASSTAAPNSSPVVPNPSTTAPSATPVPSTTAEVARVVYRGDPSRREIALTFDAGSDAGYTAEILRVLRQQRVRATFGLTGFWAEQNRDLLFAIGADGHAFINHSYNHASFTGASTGGLPLTSEQRALELSRTEVTVYRYTTRSTRPLFRPPYGDYDESVLRDVAAAGYDTVVMWTIDTLGWKGAPADEIVQRVLEGAEPGAIVVMHVGSQSQDAAALPAIIYGLRAEGYGFVTISEMVSALRP
jgi:peptidoglycan/xylan/chitin deacetylase (PgdA/CDA1 family)